MLNFLEGGTAGVDAPVALPGLPLVVKAEAAEGAEETKEGGGPLVVFVFLVHLMAEAEEVANGVVHPVEAFMVIRLEHDGEAVEHHGDKNPKKCPSAG